MKLMTLTILARMPPFLTGAIQVKASTSRDVRMHATMASWSAERAGTGGISGHGIPGLTFNADDSNNEEFNMDSAESVLASLRKVNDMMREIRDVLELLERAPAFVVGAMAVDDEDDVEELSTTRNDREGAPFPPTLSPVTYAGLLSAAGELMRTKDELVRIAEALATFDAIDGLDKKMFVRPLDPMVGARQHRDEVLYGVMAGTERTSRSPLDGVCFFGTDVWRFWGTPDPRDAACDDAGTLTTSGVHDGVTGTDLRRFCGPPDPRELKRMDTAGTDLRRFSGPPDPQTMDGERTHLEHGRLAATNPRVCRVPPDRV